jgi:hypothetical protein
MTRRQSAPEVCLSYLVGPGPTDTPSVGSLRIGLSNFDESVHALRLRLGVFSCDGSGPPLAQVEWSGVLPRRSNRELDASIDWCAGKLRLEQRSVAFSTEGPSGGGRLHVVRAELLDGPESAPDVIEVGVRSRDVAASRS